MQVLAVRFRHMNHKLLKTTLITKKKNRMVVYNVSIRAEADVEQVESNKVNSAVSLYQRGMSTDEKITNTITATTIYYYCYRKYLIDANGVNNTRANITYSHPRMEEKSKTIQVTTANEQRYYYYYYYYYYFKIKRVLQLCYMNNRKRDSIASIIW